MVRTRRARLAALERHRPPCAACADRGPFVYARDVDGTPVDDKLQPIPEPTPPPPCEACGREPLVIVVQYYEPGGLLT